MSSKNNCDYKPYDLVFLEQQLSGGDWKTWFSPVVNRSPTFSESFFVYFFRSLGIEYIREYIIGRYLLDFYLPHVNLCVEIDSPCFRGNGGVRSKKKKGDIKEAYLRSRGYEFIRMRWVKSPFLFNRNLTEERLDMLLQTIKELELKKEHSTP